MLDTDEKIHILLSDSRGIYIPKNFAECFDVAEWGVDKEDENILLQGPDHEFYWETWDEVLRCAEYHNEQGKWSLYQDGDLFATHEDFDFENWE